MMWMLGNRRECGNYGLNDASSGELLPVQAPVGWLEVLTLLLTLLLTLSLASACASPRHVAPTKPTQVLKTVRPASAPAMFQRARALQRLGRMARARSEVLLGLSMDPRAAEGHWLLGWLEVELGNRGTALRALERSLQLDPKQVCAKRVLARLLVLRARQRRQAEEADPDLDRAAELDPCLRSRVKALRRPGRRSPRATRARCLDAVAPDRPLPRQGCRLQRPGSFLASLKRRRLLLGCDGEQLALRLLDHGCVRQAREVLVALAREEPSNPRWALELGRVELALGHPLRAAQHLLSYTYLRSEHRAESMLVVARLMRMAGHCGQSARQAVESMTFATSLQQQLEALRIIRLCGMRRQAAQAGRLIIERGWSLSQDKIEQLVKQALSETVPRTPRR
jgi:tetratricopeptide (TPR) repeat protein